MDVDKDPERSETKHLLEFAEVAGKRVLEVGCGDGRLTWRYLEQARRVAAIDLERDDLRVAVIERPSDIAGKVLFVQADSTNLPFPAGSFDLSILAWSF